MKRADKHEAALVERLRCLNAPNILVVGDVLLDRYVYGDVNRVSPEGPYLVLEASSRDERLGGAGNVANCLRALGGDVALLSIVGHDAAGTAAEDLARSRGISTYLIKDSCRCTPVKERFVGRAERRHVQQMLRVDYETKDALTPPCEAELIEHLERLCRNFDRILISDYGKGTCATASIKWLTDFSRSSGIPLIADPRKNYDLTTYKGVTCFKPNRVEAEKVTGITIDHPNAALRAARRILEDMDVGTVFITLDRDGIAYASQDGETGIASLCAEDIYDVTGAGDVVLAVIGLLFDTGLPLADIAKVANSAASVKVKRFGTSTVSRQELMDSLCPSLYSKLVSSEHLQDRLCTIRSAASPVIGFTNGCFDLLHIGHVRYLEAAAARCDVLIVGINDDESACKCKGPQRPIISADERAEAIAALQCVDFVVIFSETTPCRLIDAVRPDVLIKGGDYQVEEVIGREIVHAYGGRVETVSWTSDRSTSNLISRIQSRG